ncbi:hypothetical protein E5288_WYG010202 [Bos mutus]|uniref:Uncharacterized protein n=1 Tax=Bos mutus TaxID=72004 RepID=A0A6B0R6T3_9CETA|nr:hypothetical protein [Bos mutus]
MPAGSNDPDGVLSYQVLLAGKEAGFWPCRVLLERDDMLIALQRDIEGSLLLDDP